MTVEEQLRGALHAEAGQIETDEGAWRVVQAKVQQRRARRTRAAVLTAAASVAAVVGVAAIVARDDDRRVETVPAGHDTTTVPTTAPTTTTVPPTTSTTVTPEPVLFAGIYPFSSQAEVDAYVADPGVGMFFDAEATALEFARTYVGMPDPVVDGVTQHEDGSTTVVVRPKPASPVKTRIFLVRVGGTDGPWTVEQASTEHIQVDAPAHGARVTSPLTLAGTSIAFEAVVRVEVRQDGQAFGQSLGATTVMGGGTEMAPFSGSITFEPPTERAGVVIFFTDSAEDGSIVEATVVRVAFDQP